VEQSGDAVEDRDDGSIVRPSLARLLDEEGLASKGQVEEALAEGVQTGERLGEVLLRRAVVDEVQLARMLARQWGLPFVEEEQIEPDAHALALFTGEEAQALSAVPVRRDDRVIEVVVAEPSDIRMREVRRRLGGEVQFAVVAASALDHLIRSVGSAVHGEPVEGGAESAVAARASSSVFAELIGELDEGTARVIAVRRELEQLAARLAEREQTLARYGAELADARRASELDHGEIARLRTDLADTQLRREHDQNTIAELRRELDQRTGLLASLKMQLSQITNTLGRFESE
jgi:DNA repair exonuclease SbcCD ATPase subunit